MTPEFCDPCVRSPACDENSLDGGDLTPSQRITIGSLRMVERAIRIIGLIFMTIGASVGLTMYMVQPTLAQNSQQMIDQLRIGQAQSEIRISELPRRMELIENRLSANESSISKIYGFGGGLGAIVALLQALQLISLRSKP